MSTRGGISPRRRSTSPPPAYLPDDDDMLREILLRLPPLPSSLPRASLVSKRWCSLVVDPQFQRCFRDHHGKPPLLGFFIEDFSRSYWIEYLFVPILDRPDRIPRRRLSMSLHEGDHIVDCRHGLVLSLSQRPPHRLLVWDPVSREQRRLIVPPELDNDQMFTGAVLRPAGSQGSHFQVALIASDTENTRVFACFYSSQTGIWSKINSLQLQTSKGVSPGYGPSTLIGNSLCWLLWVPPDHDLILEFDLDRQSLTVSELPPQVKVHPHKLRILRTEDGGLGFIHISMGTFHGQLWKREPGSVWVLDRAIEFEELRSACKGDRYPSIVGSSEDSNAILVQTDFGVFMVYLRSMEFKKISNIGDFRLHYPFACFYPAGTGIGDGHGEDDVLECVKWLFIETC